MAKAKKAAEAPEKAEYTVVARRYRPQQLGELIGQEHVANALTNALNSGRVAHAYLFTGARGTGKTSCARILAKCLTCEKGPTPTPCDQCEICKAVVGGDDVDILEIDGASNNKAEEARELRNNIGFRPTRARYKIYIIDEVHMLSTAAFNVLLKTLEEPPAHVKFILATTEKQKIPITILSRCQQFDFAYVKPRQIFEQLKNIVGREGLKADDDALHIIARRANGSMRDSQSLLDQMLAFCDGTLTAEKVHNLLGTAGDERVTELANAILAKDAKAAVELLQQYADRGLQLGELIDQLVEYWRGMMLVLTAGPSFNELAGSQAFQDALKANCQKTNLDTVLAGLDVLATTKARVRGSGHVATLLEMAVIRLARLEEMVSIASLLAGGTAAPMAARPTVAAEDPSKKNGIVSQNNNSSPSETRKAPANPQEIMDVLLAELGAPRHAMLCQAGLSAISGPNALVFRFPNSYSSAYEHCSAAGTIAAIAAALKKHDGQDWRVLIEADATAVPKPAAAPTTTANTSRNGLLAKPLFAKITGVLGGQLVKLDDGFETTPATAAEETEEPATIEE